ncbi:MAG: hypothetical protein ABWZ82_12070 [Candidatus Limnocylindrales bacterium]
MDLLQNLLGGDERQGLEDFAGRYEKAPPWDGVSDQEAVDRYRQVARVLPPRDYEEAARQAFERLTPEQRLEFGRYIQQRAHQQGITDFDGDGVDDRFQDPAQLARMTARAEQKQPGILEQLIGAVGGGGFGGPGQATGGGLLSSPIAKAAMAGIAAMALRKVMGR